MQVFDPTRAMNAFTAGAQIGEGIRQRQTQAGLAPLVARGDYQAASQFAGERGDLQSAEMYRQQYADQIAQMDERTKAEAAQRADTLARTAASLRNVPYEQRRMALQQSMPVLQSMGIDADMIGQFDPTDQAIDSVLAQTLPLADLLKAQQPTTLAQGSILVDPTGRTIAENPRFEEPGDQFEQFTTADGRFMQRNKRTGQVSQIYAPRAEQPGFDLQFGEGNSLQRLSYGTGGTGKEPAIVQTREGTAAVTPSPQQQSYNKAVRAVDEFAAQNSIVLGDIDRALEIIGPWSAGGGAVLKDLPIVGGMTPAGQLESLIETIAANVGFDKLQAMREASPTGGALGSVTERELAFLQAVFGSLRQDLRPENLKRNLERLRVHMAGREERIRAALAQDFPSLAQTAQFRSDTAQQVRDLTSATDDDLMSIMTGGQ